MPVASDHPIFFTDFDGVLNTPLSWGKLPRQHAIDRDKVDRLHRACKDHDARIVVSSSWRTIWTLEQLRDMLGFHGLPRHYVIDATPRLTVHGVISVPRHVEIRTWLNEHPDVKHFVIFDDANDAMLIECPHRFIQTSSSVGITDAHLERIALIFAAGGKQ